MILVFLQGGRPNPDANYLRYLASFLFLFYPLMAWALYSMTMRIKRFKQYRPVILALALGIYGYYQLQSTFQFANDPSWIGVDVGQKIKSLQLPPNQNVMIELTYWHYHAIMTGADYPTNLLFDREFALPTQAASSLFKEEPSTIHNCLGKYEIAYVFVQDNQIQQTIEDLFLISRINTDLEIMSALPFCRT